MLKIKILLSLICLFIFKASIVEANDKALNGNKDETTSPILCAENLIHTPVSMNSIDISHDARETQHRQQIQSIRHGEDFHFSGDVLLDRIRLMESQKELEDQGYTPAYIAGLDQARTYLQLAHKLRQRFRGSTHPENIHIPEFIPLINSHIDFIEEGIRAQSSADKDSRLSQLEVLKSEVRSHQDTKQMSYRYWMDVNLYLAILATPQEKLFAYAYFDHLLITPNTDHNTVFRLAKGKLDKLLDQHQFPKKIMMPTIENSGYLGIMSSNRTYGTGVHLIGLSNKSMNAHQTELSPFGFYDHDVNHAERVKIDTRPFVNFFMYKFRYLPKPQRERVELIFFQLTYEFGHRLSIIRNIRSVVENEIGASPGAYIDTTNFDYSTFLPFMNGHNHTYNNNVALFLRRARDDFVRFFTEIRREFNALEHEAAR